MTRLVTSLCRTRTRLYPEGVTTAQQSPQPRVEVLPPEEALRRAHRLPSRTQLAIQDVPEPEWDEFRQALTEA